MSVAACRVKEEQVERFLQCLKHFQTVSFDEIDIFYAKQGHIVPCCLYDFRLSLHVDRPFKKRCDAREIHPHSGSDVGHDASFLRF